LDEEMFMLAQRAMANAHAPYSNFQVGAVVRGASGTLYAGCNVENAAYPEGCCAETAAIAAMVTAGENRLTEAAVIGAGAELVTPCGGCRQRLHEFADEQTPVHVCGPDGLRRTFTLGELLPSSFGPGHVGRERDD
jgi:cytidine deaminase